MGFFKFLKVNGDFPYLNNVKTRHGLEKPYQKIISAHFSVFSSFGALDRTSYGYRNEVFHNNIIII